MSLQQNPAAGSGYAVSGSESQSGPRPDFEGQENDMPYPEFMVAPMREDLVKVGFSELKSPEHVDALLGGERRTVLMAINSVCGCAAGMMRPAVYLSLQGEKKPEILTTVFAGQDMEATEKAREYITGYPPSSPAVALFKDGELAYFMERHQIEGRHPEDIAADLKAAYEEHC
jgi:putative YphP/YqiW family bacilliredoxin